MVKTNHFGGPPKRHTHLGGLLPDLSACSSKAVPRPSCDAWAQCGDVAKPHSRDAAAQCDMEAGGGLIVASRAYVSTAIGLDL